MASTEQRTGFRFGWGSSKGDDKSAERQPEESQAGPDGAPSGPATSSSTSQAEQAWPTSDVRAPAPGALAPGATGFLSELMRAMQAAAEQTRKQIMDRFGDEARMHVDGIRSRSGEDLNELRRGADGDVASIREWSKAEIARIKSETDERIATRRAELERQVEGHGALVEREIEKFQAQVSTFEQQMDGFFTRLQEVADPSTFAAVAQGMPEPPQIEELGANARGEALAEAPISASSPTGSSWASSAPATAAARTPSDETNADAFSAAPSTTRDESSTTRDESAWAGGPTPATISDWSGGASSSAVPGSTDGWSDDSAAPSSSSSVSSADSTADSTANWSADSRAAKRDAWGSDSGTGSSSLSAWSSEAPSATTPPRSDWVSAADSTPTVPAPAAQSPDNDRIVYGAPASLAAEALSGAAPASAEAKQQPSEAPAARAADDDDFTFSADARLAALGIVRNPAPAPSPEMPPGPLSSPTAPSSPGADAQTAEQAAMAEAAASEAVGSGFASIPGQAFSNEPSSSSESPAARLAGLVPSSELPANGRSSGSPVPTQVIVTGLLSVASIASFKRHLSRIPGVQSVGVSSGPDGEFIFKTTHEPGVALAAVIPTLPGFGAEVVNAGEGTIQVAAHDPEADA